MTNLSIAQLKEAIQIKEQIGKLEARLKAIGTGKSSLPTAPKPAKRGPKTMSPEARAKIAAAARARWAKIKGTKPAPAAKPAAKPKKGGMTPELRARISAALKARWAARKKGSAAPNATATKGNKTTTVYR
jgi:hypothetical protein